MSERLVVIGGDAAGMSAASQARRRRKPDDLEIIVLEKGNYVSYSACGEPYFVSGEVEDFDDLQVRTPEQFWKVSIEARIRHEAIAIDTGLGTVTVRNLTDDSEETIGYDQLLYATGAQSIRPPIEGIDQQGIYELRTLDDAMKLRNVVTGGARKAVVVGGGFIGLEVAEAFHTLGIETTIVTMAPTVLERTFDPDMGEKIGNRIQDMGIELVTEHKVECLEGRDGKVIGVGCSDRSIEADIVVLALGSRPATRLAADAGIPLGASDAVSVDDRQRTPIDGVWSAGDCADAIHRITGRPINLHLGTVANKAGRVAGINLGGGDATFPGVLGTAITKVHDFEIARTGLAEFEAEAAGFEYVAAEVGSSTAAHYWPRSSPMRIKMVAERGTGKVLGAQIFGGTGAGKRIDTVAAALWSEMTASDLAMADLAYSPPFSGVWDPVNIAARKVAAAAVSR
jgi:NADPH-dependent 2,4-dienoyl-CoA reductase/sulfur reductase-like enzyme